MLYLHTYISRNAFTHLLVSIFILYSYFHCQVSLHAVFFSEDTISPHSLHLLKLALFPSSHISPAPSVGYFLNPPGHMNVSFSDCLLFHKFHWRVHSCHTSRLQKVRKSRFKVYNYHFQPFKLDNLFNVAEHYCFLICKKEQ